MADEVTVSIKAGDEVRVHYHPPGQVMSFAEGVVSRVNVTTTRGPGFLIDITREVFLGREQPVKPGYEHYVLYEQLEDFPEKVEVLSQVQREPEGDPEHRSEADVEQQPETEIEGAPEPEPKPQTEAERDAERSLCPTQMLRQMGLPSRLSTRMVKGEADGSSPSSGGGGSSYQSACLGRTPIPSLRLGESETPRNAQE